MSTLTSILDGIVSLMEGTTGTNRTVTAGTFKHYDSASAFSPNAMASNPRPFYFEEVEDSEDEDTPSDVAGNYIYESHTVRMFVCYASEPNKQFALEKQLQEDSKTIKRCLGYPSNWATVSQWVGADIQINRGVIVQVKEDSDEEIGQTLAVDIDLTYREDME